MRVPEQSWVHRSLELRSSRIHGLGVFASAPIQRGEVVIIWGGRLLTSKDVEEGLAQPQTVVQIGEDLFLGGHASDPMTLDD